MQILNISEIYKLEVAKFIAKVTSKSLPVLCSEQLLNFSELSSIHTYSTRNAMSNKFFLQRTSYAKTNQSLKVTGVKIWNGLPDHLRNKAVNSSIKTFSKLLKQYFLEQDN